MVCSLCSTSRLTCWAASHSVPRATLPTLKGKKVQWITTMARVKCNSPSAPGGVAGPFGAAEAFCQDNLLDFFQFLLWKEECSSLSQNIKEICFLWIKSWISQPLGGTGAFCVHHRADCYVLTHQWVVRQRERKGSSAEESEMSIPPPKYASCSCSAKKKNPKNVNFKLDRRNRALNWFYSS